MSPLRTRSDRCPGVFRPWPADDGALVRLRPAGGRVPGRALVELVGVAEEHGDGRVRLTGRANLQLRGLALAGDGTVPAPAVAAIEATGLLPSRSHELVRNLMMSPQTGLSGGRADLRPVLEELDERLCADPDLAALPGRFLFVLDDGRGDLVRRTSDLGLVAVTPTTAQLRVGTYGFGRVLPLAEAAAALVRLARRFLEVRGEGSAAAWHVDELSEPLCPLQDEATHHRADPLPHGPVDGGDHVAVPEEGVDRALATWLAGTSELLVVTPWRGILVPAPAVAGVSA